MVREPVIRTVAVVAAIVASGWPIGAASAQEAAGRRTAFVGVSVLPMDSDRVLPDHSVIVSDGVITAMGPSAQIPVPADARIIDGRGKHLMPGLADLHVHLVGDRDTQLALLKAFVVNGVTTILNVRGTPEHLALRADVASGAAFGPTIYTAGPYVNEPFVTTADAVEQAVVEQKRAGYDFVKMHGDLSREAYARLNAVGRRERIPIIGHSPRNLGFEAMFEERQYAVVHAEEFIYDRTGSSRDFAQIGPRAPEIARAAAKAGLWVMPNLTAFRNIALQINDLPAMLERPEMALLPSVIRDGWGPSTNVYTRRFGKDRYAGIMAIYAMLETLTRGFRDAGVGLLVGTDALNTGTVPGTSAHDELALLVSAGLTPHQALRAATANAAAFLQRRDLGTVAVGKKADLLLLDGNPLDDITHTRRIAGVMVRGRWLSRSDVQRLVDDLTRAK